MSEMIGMLHVAAMDASLHQESIARTTLYWMAADEIERLRGELDIYRLGYQAINHRLYGGSQNPCPHCQCSQPDNVKAK